MPASTPEMLDHAASAVSRPAAIVYCEGHFAGIDGKTANGLTRHSGTYEIAAVIDSQRAGMDAGMVLDGIANGIPLVIDLDAALKIRPDASTIIIGLAPTSGLLGAVDRAAMLAAMGCGLDLVNGLHEFLADDPEFAAAALTHDVAIRDIRRPRATKDLRMFTGRIDEVTCPVIAILGTDGAIGKRTTATVLTRVLREAGINAVMVSTGQTGVIQGARFGIALDAIPAQFAIGELEGAVMAAFEEGRAEVIIVEGQGALSHPAYISSMVVLRGSRPDGVIVQHAPARTSLSDFPAVAMPTPASEIALIEAVADTTVIGLTINHEGMTDDEVSVAIGLYEIELGIPVTDALTRPAEALVDMVLLAFPTLVRRVALADG